MFLESKDLKITFLESKDTASFQPLGNWCSGCFKGPRHSCSVPPAPHHPTLGFSQITCHSMKGLSWPFLALHHTAASTSTLCPRPRPPSPAPHQPSGFSLAVTSHRTP